MVSATDQTKANTHLSAWPSALVCDRNHAFPVLGFRPGSRNLRPLAGGLPRSGFPMLGTKFRSPV